MTESISNKESPWSRIPIDLIRNVSTIPVDLFIKISEVRQEKVYNANDLTLKEVIDKHSSNKIENLYCRIEDLKQLTDLLINDEAQLEKVHKVSLLKNLVSSLGISDEVAQEINRITDANIDLVKSDKNVSKSLKEFMKKGDYLAQHAMMLAFITSLMAKEMGIASPQVNQKLTYASMLHDMTLSSEILLNLKESESLDETKLSWQELKKYKNHVQDILEHLNKTSKIPADIADIINDHHELSPSHPIASKKSPTMVSQINALFAISDEFCHQVHREEDIYLDEFRQNWDTFYEHYNKGNFKKPLECLKTIVFNKIDLS